MEEKFKIIDLAEERFFKEGFQKVTMDDVAAELKMSKKTIYKFFPSKEGLVHSIAKHFMNKMKNKIIPTLSTDKNAIEKLHDLLTILANTAQRMGEKWLDDIRRYFPNLWKEIDAFRTEMMFGNLSKVINQGKQEGLFLDYPTPIIMNILVSSVRTVVSPEFIINNNFSIQQAAFTTFKIVIGGITTEKGKLIFNETINKK